MKLIPGNKAVWVASVAAFIALESWPGPALTDTDNYLSPSALVAHPDGSVVFVACATAGKIIAFDATRNSVRYSIKVPDSPLGLAISRDGTRIFVTCASPTSTVCVIDIPSRAIVARIPAGHTTQAPVLSPDEKTLFVCNRFNDDVSVIDLAQGREVQRIKVEREPFAAAITPDGRQLIVANHLHGESANALHLAAKVTVIDTSSLTVKKHIQLPLGAGFLKGVAVSPDGRFAAVSHVRATYWLTTAGVELGRMNACGLTFLDLEQLEFLGMIFLDQTQRGGANPWGVAWTPDGHTVIVCHAGANAVSLVDAPKIPDRWSFALGRIGDYAPSGKSMAPLPKQNPVRLRKRVMLPGHGPRALTISGSSLYTANYFSDMLCRIDLSASEPMPEELPLGPVPAPSLARKGEMFFNDGRICFQGWQSCASCHDSDGRADALNWDLLNDGANNPKNTRSLLWAHCSGPAMALGVRTNAHAAVRAGIHHILFSEDSEDVANAIDAYLQSLRPMQSPHLVKGALSEAARRGQQLFFSQRTGCADCHPKPLYTDMQGHDVGTSCNYHSLYGSTGADKASDRFYSPPLVELWRTAPFLHDGSAPTLLDVLTTRNRADRHGRTSSLSPAELEDLAAFLLSL